MTVINRADLLSSGFSQEFEGYLYGDIPICLLEILVVQDGNATFTAGNATIEATAGQIVIAPAGVPHRFLNCCAPTGFTSST